MEKAYKDIDCEILLPSSDEHASRGKCLENGQRNPHNIWLVVGEAKLEKYTELNDFSNTPATFFFLVLHFLKWKQIFPLIGI